MLLYQRVLQWFKVSTLFSCLLPSLLLQLLSTTAAMLEQQGPPAAATSRCWHALQEQLESQALHLSKQSTHHNCHSPHHPFYVCPFKCAPERSVALQPRAALSCAVPASCCRPAILPMLHVSKAAMLEQQGPPAAATSSCRHALQEQLESQALHLTQIPTRTATHHNSVCVCHCRKRGPQAMRRTVVRRLCKLLPPCEFDYNLVNKQCGLSSKGLQWAQEHCEAFFLRVLGDPRQPGSAPWPAVSEMKPKQELKYFASECVSVLAC
jgi:hypothetical protein